MSRTLLFLICLVTAAKGYSQAKPLVKAYAYLRESVPGAIPKTIDENGKEINTGPVNIKSYQLFLEYKKGTVLRPLRIWIDGRAYGLTMQTIGKTPYTFSRPGIGSNVEIDTLVKKTSNNVYRIVPAEEISGTSSSKFAQVRNGLVIEYYVGKKLNHYVVKDIRKLSPMILE